MTKQREFSRLDTKVAYPWPVEADMPPDVTDMDMSDVIYGPYVVPQSESDSTPPT
ncbi:hypothetical protein [Acetobacter lovaniensis]|uniref:Uncharacterized protein n=1 Tax=Acetobacter lovaniensis TaxID=104100 RepID=A0A841QIL9_9PROT|nr:hypothetical protein [Acetobacter lovaniensis]MBB6457993.1 hypothetical protein [Acetobacter lovaniensis]NHN82250.1 hypothetical protein [Acetobacter lovaniensis]GBQ72868.1 hypothetical protein AA0474_2804 [Acetobacter lovaniensis NRIC 0474]